MSKLEPSDHPGYMFATLALMPIVTLFEGWVAFKLWCWHSVPISSSVPQPPWTTFVAAILFVNLFTVVHPKNELAARGGHLQHPHASAQPLAALENVRRGPETLAAVAEAKRRR